MSADHAVCLTPCAVCSQDQKGLEGTRKGKRERTSLKLCVLASCAKVFLFNGQICGFPCSLFLFQQSLAFQTRSFSHAPESWTKNKAASPPAFVLAVNLGDISRICLFLLCSGCEFDERTSFSSLFERGCVSGASSL